jgi:hypothetical protein
VRIGVKTIFGFKCEPVKFFNDFARTVGKVD